MYEPQINLDRPALTNTTKISGRTKYRPLELTDESVYELAQHYYTTEQIAEDERETVEKFIKSQIDKALSK